MRLLAEALELGLELLHPRLHAGLRLLVGVVELVVQQFLRLELGEHDHEPLEQRQVGEARDPEEVEVLRLEALLPPVVDDALHDRRARRDADPRADDQRGVVHEDVLRRRAVRRVDAEERLVVRPDHLAERRRAGGRVARHELDLALGGRVEELQVLRHLVRPREGRGEHPNVDLEDRLVGRRGDRERMPLGVLGDGGALEVEVVAFHVLDRLDALVVDGVVELQRNHVGRLHLAVLPGAPEVDARQRDRRAPAEQDADDDAVEDVQAEGERRPHPPHRAVEEQRGEEQHEEVVRVPERLVVRALHLCECRGECVSVSGAVSVTAGRLVDWCHVSASPCRWRR